MFKKNIILFTALSITFMSFHASMCQTVPAEEKNISVDFTDIFDNEDDDQVQLHEHDAEEVELEHLGEKVVPATPPSKATLMMQQLGIKVLIGYLAMRSYFENMWSSIKHNTYRFKSWVLREQID